MSLQTWLDAQWLRPHTTSPEEIRDLWLIAERDLRDAAVGGISHDWQYGIAYNAALKLCTILLYAGIPSRKIAGPLPYPKGASLERKEGRNVRPRCRVRSEQAPPSSPAALLRSETAN